MLRPGGIRYILSLPYGEEKVWDKEGDCGGFHFRETAVGSISVACGFPPQATEPRILICNVFYNSNLSLDAQSLGGLS